jgi:hypothetical protein
MIVSPSGEGSRGTGSDQALAEQRQQAADQLSLDAVAFRTAVTSTRLPVPSGMIV